ncbi:hypothetical protein ERO13_A13G083166v2 [Gossypium hirsutum]|nr:hypothetical protein ERO13_A13G083166v2 [Gossypium hirsutum]TYH91091.1 hypothetical protein ES332_A13G094300v1 [Gossypium tomentosum]KAG4165459.1 hypothetical protein ERO13_A13G083166v2 [Gossypium hirsutum]KAG4165460.1 hypothetical protein ERO13_A13G083166v2 [Gossypium hirsutum]TYH91092.1 hypothetical protein ES332_A13G094300v1 [Gossypium tomentosum]
MKLCLLHTNPILLTLLPKFAFVFQYSIYVLICVSTKQNDWTKAICLFSFASYSILAAFGELETQALQVDYAIWAAQKAVTKAKYEWEQAFTLMKELKLKPPLLTFRAWIWATGTVQIIARDKIPQTSENICYLCKHFLVR